MIPPTDRHGAGVTVDRMPPGIAEGHDLRRPGCEIEAVLLQADMLRQAMVNYKTIYDAHRHIIARLRKTSR